MTEPIWADDGDDEAVVKHVATRLAGAAEKSIAVPGGRTPLGILKSLAAQPLPWDRVTITPTDERQVAVDHPSSNFGALAAVFSGRTVRVRPLVEGRWSGWFNLVWLGMGEDGHVASIFQGEGAADAREAAVVHTEPNPLPPEAPFSRLTLTLPALTNADEIILVLRGETKRRVLEKAIAHPNGLPVERLIATARSPITIFWSVS